MGGDRYNDISDQELLDKYYASRDTDWLGVLLERYTLLLLGLCMKYLKNEEEARDSVQQVFLKALQELRKYRVTYFKSWIYMVARNHCLMKLRNKNGHVATELNEQIVAAPSEETEKVKQLQNEQVMELMEESLQELNPEQQQCVTLFYLQKLSYQQISEQTGLTMLQVKSHIQNGKRNLKLMIERKLKDS